MVRHFNDQIGESSNAFHHKEGVIDVIPLRDEKGELTGLRQASDEEYAKRTENQEELRAQFPAGLSEDSCMELGETDPAAYRIYEPFGLVCEKDGLFFEGERVRYFLDGAEIARGCLTSRCEYLDEKGTVDVHTVRTVIDNGDGSFDPFGELIRLERYSKEEFDKRDPRELCGTLQEVTTDSEAESGGIFGWLFGRRNQGESFEKRFEQYSDFGITYVEADEGSGAGNVYYREELVRCFADQDPEGGVFSFQSADKGGIDVRTVYDSGGRLCGVEKRINI